MDDADNADDGHEYGHGGLVELEEVTLVQVFKLGILEFLGFEHIPNLHSKPS